MNKHLTLLRHRIFQISLFTGLAFGACKNPYKHDNLVQITTHRIKPSMKKVYEDLVENEFAIANREYRLKDPDEQKLHSIAMESVKVYQPKKQNINPVTLQDSILT